MHTSIYQKWFSLENRKVAIEEAIKKKSKVEELQGMVMTLERENERLKIENERLKLQMGNLDLIQVVK
jgi:regulator of replication initiation timing